MDISSSKNLLSIYSDYEAAGLRVFFTGLSEPCLETMRQSGILKDMPKDVFFHAVHDVVIVNASSIKSIR